MTNRTEQGKHLLKMIEAVDVNDTDTLREIEARFWCFLNGYTYAKHDGRDVYALCDDTQCEVPVDCMSVVKKYLRDLQALHDAMPDDVEFVLQKFNCSDCMAFDCKFTAIDFDFYTPELPTMHLAWLHAIIQAYIYMEGNDE